MTVAWLSDPGGMYFRRALRIAVVLPPTYFIVQDVMHLDYGSGIASFTSYALLALADFGGPPKSRARAYALTGLVGLPLIVIGSLLANFLVISILAAGVVAFAVNYSGVLRGYFAAAGVALLLPFVMAITSSPMDTEVMLQLCAGYAIGVCVSLVAALVLWPSYLGSKLRRATASALTATADEVANRWLTGSTAQAMQDARNRTKSAVTQTRELFDGALGRPGPGTNRDRSLVAVIMELDRVNRVLEWQSQSESTCDPVDFELATAVVSALRTSADTLAGGHELPDPSQVNQSREQHQLLLEERTIEVLRAGAGQTGSLAEDLSGPMPLRIVALSAQSIAGNIPGAVGRQPTASAAVTLGGEQLWDPTQRLGARHYLISQFAWSSPWVRNAIRTGVAIAVATAIVQITHIPHGMWIVLGTLVALKFDASGTSRTAAAVLFGTVIGFALASAVVYLVGTNDVALWILLPLAVFLAAYTPNSISLAVGQATFAVYGVILYALLLPSGYTTAEFRLFDVSVAMIVSLVVSALLWPRGVVPLVSSTLHSSAATAGAFLVDATATLTNPARNSSSVSLPEDQTEALRALTLAKQTYDLAYAQRGPGTPDILVWSNQAEAVSNVERTAEIVKSVVHHGRTAGGDQRSQQSLLTTAKDINACLSTIVGDSDPGVKELGPESRLRASVDQLQSAIADYVAAECSNPHLADPKDITALIWLSDWMQYAAWETGFASERHHTGNLTS